MKQGKSQAHEAVLWRKRAQRAALGGSNEEEDYSTRAYVDAGNSRAPRRAAGMENKDFLALTSMAFLFKDAGGIAIENEPRGTRREESEDHLHHLLARTDLREPVGGARDGRETCAT